MACTLPAEMAVATLALVAAFVFASVDGDDEDDVVDACVRRRGPRLRPDINYVFDLLDMITQPYINHLILCVHATPPYATTMPNIGNHVKEESTNHIDSWQWLA